MENPAPPPDDNGSSSPTAFGTTSAGGEAYDALIAPQGSNEDEILERVEAASEEAPGSQTEVTVIQETEIELGDSNNEAERSNLPIVSIHMETDAELLQRPASVPPGENLTMVVSRPQSSISYCNRIRMVTPKITTRLTSSSRLDTHSWSKTKINSAVLRQAAYEKWYFTRASEFQQHLQNLKQQQSGFQKAQQQERDARCKEAHVIYQSWKEKKEGYLAQVRKEAKLLAEKERHEEKLKREKQEEANMVTMSSQPIAAGGGIQEFAFKSWKSQKDEMLREQRKQQQEAEKRQKQKEEAERKEKQMDAQSSFEAWKRRKNEEHQEASETLLKTSLLSEMEDRDHKIQRDAAAVHAFQIWLNNKEFERQHRVTTSNPSRRRNWDDRPPWLPPGRGSCGCGDPTCAHM